MKSYCGCKVIYGQEKTADVGDLTAEDGDD